jgi:hypothetical protein
MKKRSWLKPLILALGVTIAAGATAFVDAVLRYGLFNNKRGGRHGKKKS